jgi:hypothetical protein
MKSAVICRCPPATSNPPHFYQTATHGDSHSFLPPAAPATSPTVEQLYEALREPAGLRRDPLIEEIRLVPEDRRLRVELRGELAGIPAPSADGKKAGRTNQAGCGDYSGDTQPINGQRFAEVRAQ